jgi:hypothetical protein
VDEVKNLFKTNVIRRRIKQIQKIIIIENWYREEECTRKKKFRRKKETEMQKQAMVISSFNNFCILAIHLKSFDVCQLSIFFLQ